MFSEMFQSTSAVLFAVGFGINAIAGVWFLFASYSADRRLARWSRALPILSIRLVAEHPNKCLIPFILQHIGVLLCLPLIVRFLRAFDAVREGAL
jgi:hypothetical protein